ncbi:MAG: serine/threonine-protein kinase [Polyangiales bacterium]
MAPLTCRLNMAGAVRGSRTDHAASGHPSGAPSGTGISGAAGRPSTTENAADKTADALTGDSEFVCVDCDARQVDLIERCPSCGGVVVAKHAMEESDYDGLIGRKIGGRFTVIARLGAGSMGAVYRARQEGMHREVALKVLKPERAFDASSKARFEREARATSALTSPHTVTVYDFGEDETTPQGPILYLAMERLEGEPLGQRIKRVGRIAPNDAVKIAQQALRSLAEAHEKGVVHRDLKPDNIFLHRVPTPHGLEEVVKVLDFGIAKILQPDLKVDSLETQAGTVFGTPRYMSPEQAQSKPLDGLSDLYTIGLILFQMVTGRHCFPDEDAVVVMARHIQSLPPRPREVAPDAGISRKLEAVILKALAKDPKRRPQTALELHEELADALKEPPETARLVAAESGVLRVSMEPALTTPASPSIGPTADPSIEIDTQSIRRRRNRAQLVAYVGGFAFLLVGAMALGVRLARSGPSSSVVSESPGGEARPATDPVTKDTATTSPTTTATPESTETMPTAIVEPAGTKPSKPLVATGTKKTATPKASAEPPPTATTNAAPTVTAPPTATATATPTASSKKPTGYGKFD